MNDLKAYLALKERTGELASRIAEHIRTQPTEKDEVIALERKELSDVLHKIKKMEEDAGFVEEYGRIRRAEVAHRLEGLRHNIAVREETIETMRGEIVYLENLNQLDRRKIENLVAQMDKMEEGK